MVTNRVLHLTVVQFLTLSLLIHHFRVGLTAKEAQSQGYNYIENTLLVAQIPRHKINNDARGIFKVIIDKRY